MYTAFILMILGMTIVILFLFIIYLAIELMGKFSKYFIDYDVYATDTKDSAVLSSRQNQIAAVISGAVTYYYQHIDKK